MGDIGKEKRTIEVLPLEEPVYAPSGPAPAQVPEPAPEPAEPVQEPAHSGV